MLSDSRLLNNLLKTEKDSQKSFAQWTSDAASASSALSAWAVADSGETQDLMDVSMRITQLLANCADSQRRYLSSLSVYRSSLKQVLERESTLRTVVRDREILVGRLIKLGNKKPGDSAVETHQLKLEDAQRELAACEACLQSEQAALGDVKRRIFRESLSARMKSMGELGATMEESAKEAMELLSQLAQGYDGEVYHNEGLGSQAGDSITPSLSASQALSQQSSMYSSSDDERDNLPAQINIPAPHQISKSTSTYYPTPVLTTSNSSAQLQNGSATPTRASTMTSTRPRQRTSSVPILPSVPVAARGAPSPMPFIEIPKAPTNVGSRRPTDDSSDEEDEQAFVSMANGNTRATTSRGGAPPASDSSPKRFLRRRAHSDTSTITGTDRGREQTKKTGFFGGIASLFKRAPPRDSSPPSQRRQGSSSTNQWDTRTDRNVFTAARGAGGGGRKGADDSSDDDLPKQRLIRVVNDPTARAKAMSDVGAASASIKSKKSLGKKKTTAQSSSDVGMTRSSTSLAVSSMETKQKTKRRSESMNAIDMLATPLPLPSAAKPTPAAVPRSSALSRSNTVTSSFSTTTIGTLNTVGGSAKPKRKKRISTASPLMPLLREPLTAADLASSLPSSRSYATIHHDAGTTRGENGVLLGGDELVHGQGKAPSHLRETEKRVVKENIKYGVEGWVNKPSSPALGASDAAVFQPVERRENILAVVDRAEADDTSRRYGSTPKWIKPASVSTTSLVPAAIPRSRDSLQPPGMTTLAKRKSVRMAELDPNSMEPPRSPAGSVRSEGPATSSNGGAPRPGILVNHHPSPSQLSLNGANGGSQGEHSTWNMRSSSSAALGGITGGDDSSDEDEGEYALARKAFAKGTKKLELAGLPESSPRRDKGKGRAVEQY